MSVNETRDERSNSDMSIENLDSGFFETVESSQCEFDKEFDWVDEISMSIQRDNKMKTKIASFAANSFEVTVDSDLTISQPGSDTAPPRQIRRTDLSMPLKDSSASKESFLFGAQVQSAMKENSVIRCESELVPSAITISKLTRINTWTESFPSRVNNYEKEKTNSMVPTPTRTISWTEGSEKLGSETRHGRSAFMSTTLKPFTSQNSKEFEKGKDKFGPEQSSVSVAEVSEKADGKNQKMQSALMLSTLPLSFAPSQLPPRHPLTRSDSLTGRSGSVVSTGRNNKSPSPLFELLDISESSETSAYEPQVPPMPSSLALLKPTSSAPSSAAAPTIEEGKKIPPLFRSRRASMPAAARFGKQLTVPNSSSKGAFSFFSYSTDAADTPGPDTPATGGLESPAFDPDMPLSRREMDLLFGRSR